MFIYMLVATPNGGHSRGGSVCCPTTLGLTRGAPVWRHEREASNVQTEVQMQSSPGCPVARAPAPARPHCLVVREGMSRAMAEKLECIRAAHTQTSFFFVVVNSS